MSISVNKDLPSLTESFRGNRLVRSKVETSPHFLGVPGEKRMGDVFAASFASASSILSIWRSKGPTFSSVKEVIKGSRGRLDRSCDSRSETDKFDEELADRPRALLNTCLSRLALSLWDVM